ncbi:MAG: thioredoxin-disulfide reductase [Lachnospiraceae bacterium]
MAEQKNYDVVIIGGGPGGYAAALYCARAELSAVVLEKLSPGGQMGTTETVENYPGFAEGINGFELGMQMQQGAERFGVKTELAEVVKVDLKSSPKVVETEDGVFYGKTVILATGASPRELGVPGERDLRGRGVSYCATCDGMFYRGKSVVIAGGGNTAVADALFLAKICKRVVLVHRREELRASKVYMNALKDTPNIEFVWNSVVTDILQETNVTGVRVRNKKTEEVTVIPCDGIFVAIGNLPNTDLVKDQITLDEGGYVIADETTQTNIPGVFAIGDMRKKPLRQIVTAVADGAVASKYAEEFILI